jgi:hypothetical protein
VIRPRRIPALLQDRHGCARRQKEQAVMFAKSKQIGLVSLLVVLGAMVGGCAESVGNEP